MASQVLRNFLVAFFCLSSWAVAQPLPNPPEDRAWGLKAQPVLSEVASNQSKIPAAIEAAHTIEFTLPDGTKIGGLLFLDPQKGVRPLILADFGMLSSRWSALNADMVDNLILPGLLHANMLLLDNISGAAFLRDNHNLSLGGYDAGRVLVQVAQEIRKRHIPYTTLHLLGESLGGLAVMEGALEDQRLGTGLFRSAISFSGVIDEVGMTAAALANFGRRMSGLIERPLSNLGKIFLIADFSVFNADIKARAPGVPEIGLFGAGDVFYNEFSERLQFLSPRYDWNPSVSRYSVEEYLTTSDALLSGIGSLQTPILLVHAKNDTLVDFNQFEEFATVHADNPKILTFATERGGHCGFSAAFGPDWVAGLINRSLTFRK